MGMQRRNLTQYEDRQAARTRKPQPIGEVLNRTNPGIVTAPGVGLNTTPDPRARPQPECICPLCSAEVDQLVQIMRHGKHTLACAKCAAKRNWCPVCDDYVERVAFVDISPTASQSVCPDCAPIVRYSPPEPIVDTLPIDPYCYECFEPFTPKYPHQHRCAQCAETIAAQWAAVPPKDKPPKLVLVKEPEKLAPMVLWRAMWLQAWNDWQVAHNPAVLIRRLDANIKAGPGVAKCADAPQWERLTEDELRQRMASPKPAPVVEAVRAVAA
jgi:hypothetical protein